MDFVYEMGTTTRHADLVSEIMYQIKYKFYEFFKQGKFRPLQEQLSLAYLGDYKDLSSVSLIDVTDESVANDIKINLLNCVQPDFFYYMNNKFITNTEETRYIGTPDLIVEVWSSANSRAHMLFKETLYSTSKNTEHWYIQQDSNLVDCRFGTHLLDKQNLAEPLITQSGITLDLTHLAL